MFGIWNKEGASNITFYALHSLQHRGQQGGGIVSTNRERLRGYRNIGLLAEVFKDNGKLERIAGTGALGALWYSSGNSTNVHNIEPLLFKFNDGHLGIAMNGNLINAKSLRAKLEDAGAVFHSESHAEIIMHLIRRSRKKKIENRFKEALTKLEGSFSVILLTQDSLIGAVDKHATRPLVLGKLDDSYTLASESCALNVIGADFIRDISAGEMVIIDDDGYKMDKFTDPSDIAIEAMEFIYFARPDSTIMGKNVHIVRKNTGRILAREYPVDADIVVGVPNSSLSLATGYAEELGLPYEMGLIKNQYIGRTFIEPSQNLRDLAVKMKLSALPDVVRGQRVILLDDSVVRGTTSKRIISMLKDRGAKEVHLRIGSPEIIFPSYSGIDMKTSKELIAANMTKDEIRDLIGADSLEFISIAGLQEAVGFDYPGPNKGISLEIFNGKYIDGLCDYEEELKSELTNLQKEFLENKGV